VSIDAPNLEAAAQGNQSSQARFVISVLFDHWFMIAFATVAGALLFGAVAYMRQEITLPRYQTFAEVAIETTHWDTSLLQGIGGQPLFATEPSALVRRTSMQTLAREVARAMVQRDIAAGGEMAAVVGEKELASRANDIANKLALLPLDDSRRIRLEVARADSDEEAETIAEMAARVFVDMNREMQFEEGAERHAFIKDELAELRKKLFEAQTAEWEYKRELGFRDYAKVDEEMSAMYEELDGLRVQRGVMEDKLAELRESLERNREQFPESLNHVTDSVVDKLFNELDALLQKQLEMSAIYQPDFPGLRDLEAEIADKQRAILEADQQLTDGVPGGSDVWRNRQAIYQQQIDLRLELARTEIRAASLEKMLDEMIPRVPELANKNLEFERLAQQTASIRNQFEKLSQREWDVRTALEKGPGRIVRYEAVKPASVMPIRSQSTRLSVNFLIGAIAGFLCAFCYAMLQEASDTSIRSVEDVNEYLGLEAIGTIPRMRFGKPRGGRRKRATYVTTVDEEQIDACIVTQHDPKSPISEAYRTLRTNFQFATMTQKPRTVMVTSAVPGEGKTTTAVNLAVTMADRGIRVLIVDTDLRRPNVHRVLRMERGPGLADVLREGLDPKSVVRPTRIENLWIISSGRVPPNPSELIGSDRMASLMEQLGGEFDLVICDAPSVLVVTDPVLLATHVDSAVMVVSTNNARRETVIRAKKLLETANGIIAGVVVNGLETTRRHYYYYYYYYDDNAPVRRKWYHFY